MNTAALQNSKHNTAETVISARSLRQVFHPRGRHRGRCQLD